MKRNTHPSRVILFSSKKIFLDQFWTSAAVTCCLCIALLIKDKFLKCRQTWFVYYFVLNSFNLHDPQQSPIRLILIFSLNYNGLKCITDSKGNWPAVLGGKATRETHLSQCAFSLPRVAFLCSSSTVRGDVLKPRKNEKASLQLPEIEGFFRIIPRTRLAMTWERVGARGGKVSPGVVLKDQARSTPVAQYHWNSRLVIADPR